MNTKLFTFDTIFGAIGAFFHTCMEGGMAQWGV